MLTRSCEQCRQITTSSHQSYRLSQVQLTSLSTNVTTTAATFTIIATLIIKDLRTVMYACCSRVTTLDIRSIQLHHLWKKMDHRVLPVVINTLINMQKRTGQLLNASQLCYSTSKSLTNTETVKYTVRQTYKVRYNRDKHTIDTD